MGSRTIVWLGKDMSTRQLIIIGSVLLAAFAASSIARQFVGENRCASFDLTYKPGKGCVNRNGDIMDAMPSR